MKQPIKGRGIITFRPAKTAHGDERALITGSVSLLRPARFQVVDYCADANLRPIFISLIRWRGVSVWWGGVCGVGDVFFSGAASLSVFIDKKLSDKRNKA